MEPGRSNIRMPEWVDSGKSFFLLCRWLPPWYILKQLREKSLSCQRFKLTIRIPHSWPNLNLIISQRYHFQMPSQWFLGSQQMKFVVVQLLNCVWLFATPWTVKCQASLSLTISQSLLILMSIELVMPSNHLSICPLLLLLSIFPSISLFQWVGSSHQVAKVLELQLQHQFFQWIFRVDFL